MDTSEKEYIMRDSDVRGDEIMDYGILLWRSEQAQVGGALVDLRRDGIE